MFVDLCGKKKVITTNVNTVIFSLSSVFVSTTKLNYISFGAESRKGLNGPSPSFPLNSGDFYCLQHAQCVAIFYVFLLN